MESYVASMTKGGRTTALYRDAASRAISLRISGAQFVSRVLWSARARSATPSGDLERIEADANLVVSLDLVQRTAEPDQERVGELVVAVPVDLRAVLAQAAAHAVNKARRDEGQSVIGDGEVFPVVRLRRLKRKHSRLFTQDERTLAERLAIWIC